jgi:hypothetical protein
VPLGFALYFHSYSTWEGYATHRSMGARELALSYAYRRLGVYLEDLYVVPAARGSGVLPGSA